jgi:hypothetical protein
MRHRHGVHAISSGVPLNMLAKLEVDFQTIGRCDLRIPIQ